MDYTYGFCLGIGRSVGSLPWGCGGVFGCLGVIGEYIGKIYLETKARPRFIVEQFLDEAAQREKNEND